MTHVPPRSGPWPLAVLIGLAVTLLAALALVPGALAGLLLVIGDPLWFLVGVVVATLCVSAVADGVAGWRGDGRSGRVLRRGVRAVEGGGDARGIAGRLRGAELQGRAAMCRDVAARCLEGAGRCGRLERRLRREAAGWLREALREMRRWKEL